MRHKGQTLPGSVKERVAEYMSQGLTPPEIAERMSRTRRQIAARISDIRRDLGWQAV